MNIFKPDELEIIAQGFFALLTGLITFWALNWASVWKKNDASTIRILHLLAGILLVFITLYRFWFQLTFKQTFVLSFTTFAIIVLSAELTIRIPELRDGVRLSRMRKIDYSINELRDRLDMERNSLLFLCSTAKDNQELEQYFNKAIISIINIALPEFIKINGIKRNFNTSFFIANQDKSLQLATSYNVPLDHKKRIQSSYRWADPINGLVGYAINEKKILNIVDFANPEYRVERSYWEPSAPNEKLHSSFYCVPIVFGSLIDENPERLGGVCVTVKGKFAWRGENLGSTVKMVAEYVETIMYIRKLYGF